MKTSKPRSNRSTKTSVIHGGVFDPDVIRQQIDDQESMTHDPTFWTDQYDTTVQFAGLTDAGTRPDVRGDPASGAFVVHCLRDDELVGVVGVNRPRDVRQARVAIEAGSLTAHERKTP